MGDALWMIVGVVAIAGLIWLAFRIEPHWASKDGQRFTCRVLELGRDMSMSGLTLEMRARVIDDELMLSARGFRGRSLSGVYQVLSSSAEPPRGKEVYFLTRDARHFILRVPASSRAVATLDGLLTSPPDRTRRRPADG